MKGRLYFIYVIKNASVEINLKGAKMRRDHLESGS